MIIKDVEIGSLSFGDVEPGQMFMYTFLYYVKIEPNDLLTPLYKRQYALCLNNSTLVTLDINTVVSAVKQLTLQDSRSEICTYRDDAHSEVKPDVYVPDAPMEEELIPYARKKSNKQLNKKRIVDPESSVEEDKPIF